MTKIDDQKYIYCIHKLKEILKEYESGSFSSSLAEISCIVDDLKPEDFAVYGKPICHMLIDVAQHERFNIPIYNQRPHSFDSLQNIISTCTKLNTETNKKIKNQKITKTSKNIKKRVKKERNDIQIDSEFADSDSDSDPKYPHEDDELHFGNDQFYSNYKYKACNKKYKTKKGDHFQNICSYEMTNDYYPTFPQWIPTVDLSKLKKKKRFVLCE